MRLGRLKESMPVDRVAKIGRAGLTFCRRTFTSRPSVSQSKCSQLNTINKDTMGKTLKAELEAILQPLDQTHVLRFWDELDASSQQSLADQIRAIDFEQLKALAGSTGGASKWDELAAKAEVPPAITSEDFANPDSYRAAYDLGDAALKAGKVAMVLVAGGQGSRLGFEHPKGMFPIGPLSDRTLYQMLIDQLLARGKQAGKAIPFYIMTSPPTHAETSQFLAENNYFGMNPDDVSIFCQGTMPAVDSDGKLLLSDKGTIFASPDGHGGTLGALKRDGCLDDMKARGIEHVFYGQVDNPLIQACDPALLGYHIKSGSEMTSQVVRKHDPMLKVGNVVVVDGKTQIIEYSDLPEQYARATLADGSLKLWAGSIAVHVFERAFLDRTSDQADALPFHHAHKKVAFVDSTGTLVKPAENNATKFERFIFDLLPSASNAIVCEVEPADGFCAVKNAPPAPSETPQHVKDAIVALHTRWLHEAGVKVADGVKVEINPCFALDVDQLKEKLPSGTSITEDRYIV